MAFLESRDADGCKTLLSRLQDFASKEGGNPKQAADLRSLESTCESTLAEYSIIEEQLRKTNEKQRELQARKAEENAMEEERKRLLKNIERLKARIAEEKEKHDKLRSEIEEKSSGLLHAEVEIT